MSYGKRGKPDTNQKEIVDGLRKIGASVKIVNNIDGFVDIIVGFRSKNYLIEIKDGEKPKSQQRLTEAEKKFQLHWAGQVATVTSVLESIELITENKI